MRKKAVKSSVIFALLGSTLVKAARKHVDEIKPRRSRNKSGAQIPHSEFEKNRQAYISLINK